jgi:hypothetical protein
LPLTDMRKEVPHDFDPFRSFGVRSLRHSLRRPLKFDF